MKYLATLNDAATTNNDTGTGIIDYAKYLYNSAIDYGKKKVEEEAQEWIDKNVDAVFGNDTNEVKEHGTNPKSEFANYLKSFVNQTDWDNLTYEQQQAIRQKARELGLPEIPFKDKSNKPKINAFIPSGIAAIAIYYMTKSPIGAIASSAGTYFLWNKYYNNQ